MFAFKYATHSCPFIDSTSNVHALYTDKCKTSSDLVKLKFLAPNDPTLSIYKQESFSLGNLMDLNTFKATCSL